MIVDLKKYKNIPVLNILPHKMFEIVRLLHNKAHESQSREFLKNKPLWEYIKTFEKYKERLDFRYYVRGGLFRTFCSRNLMYKLKI